MSDEPLEEQATPNNIEEATTETTDNGAVAAEEGPSLEELLAQAQAEAAKNLDGWQRSQAELSNARKRYEKMQADAYLNATSNVVAKLLPVIDDFERAFENVSDAIEDHGWFAGIQLVQRKLLTILEQLNVEPIEAVGEAFDPNYHEALSQEPSDEHESGTVTREMLRGYRIGDRVIRPALVVVAS